MKPLIFIFFIAFTLSSCRQADTEVKSKLIIDAKASKESNDTINYVVLPYDTSDNRLSNWILPNTSYPADLTARDIINIEKLLFSSVCNYNKTESKKKLNEYEKQYPKSGMTLSDFILDLSKYKRQYIAVTNNKSEKEIYVNCISIEILSKSKLDSIYWKKKYYFAYDGGKNVFRVKINLTNNTFSDLSINDNG